MSFIVHGSPIFPSQNLPQHLCHKPFYAVPYEPFDGIYASSTDTVFLSVGLAQYDEAEVSAKAMRHVSRWSRQAEEVPVHRLVDMTILTAKALFDTTNNTMDLPPGTFQGQTSTITVSQERRTPAEQKNFADFFSRNKKLVSDRLNALADVLNDLRKRGRI